MRSAAISVRSALRHRSLLSLEPHVLVRGGERVAGDQTETRLFHSRPVAAHQAELKDGRDHRLLVDELLDAVQRRLAPLLVELGALLAEEAIDVRVAAVYVRAARRDEGFDPRRGVAEGGASAVHEVSVLLVAIALLECGALERPELHANARGLERVGDRFADGHGRGIDGVVTGVQSVRISGLGEELLRSEEHTSEL